MGGNMPDILNRDFECLEHNNRVQLRLRRLIFPLTLFVFFLAIFIITSVLTQGIPDRLLQDNGPMIENYSDVPLSDSRFTDNSDGTITDNVTGLMWTKNANLPETYKTWKQALDYVASMNSGAKPNFGYGDWRLPQISELENLVNEEVYGPAFPLEYPFINRQDHYWSSRNYGYTSYIEWTNKMINYYMYAISKYDDVSYVWPVRSASSP